MSFKFSSSSHLKQHSRNQSANKKRRGYLHAREIEWYLGFKNNPNMVQLFAIICFNCFHWFSLIHQLISCYLMN